MINLWQSLGRKEAFTWISLVYLLVQQFNGVTLSNLPLHLAGREWLFIVAVVVPFIAMGALFAVGRYVLHPLLPTRLRPISTLIIFELSILLRLWLFTDLLVFFEIAPDNQFLVRLPSSQVNQMLGLVVIAYLVSSAREYTRHNDLVLRSLDELQTSQQDVYQRLSKRKDALIRSIRNQLKTELDAVVGTDPTTDAQHLKELIDNVVRPLSRKLSQDGLAQASMAIPLPNTRFEIRPLLSRTVEEKPFHPLFFVLWTFFPAWAIASGYLGDSAVAYALAVSAVFLAMLVSANWLWRFVPSTVGVAVRSVLISLVPLPIALFSTWFIGQAADTSPSGQTLTYYIYFFTVMWAIALVMTSRRMLRETNASLQAANLKLTRQLVQEKAEVRLFERRIALFLHGPVQDAIAASLKRIHKLDSASQLTPHDMAAIRHPIDSALSHLDELDAGTTDITRGISDLAELWAGVVDIDAEIEPDATDALRDVPATSSSVVEIVREALSNAIRHGDAAHIRVQVRLSESNGDVLIRVANDGQPVPASAVPGLGTTLLTDLAVSWSRQNIDGQVIVDAIVPLEAIRSA